MRIVLSFLLLVSTSVFGGVVPSQLAVNSSVGAFTYQKDQVYVIHAMKLKDVYIELSVGERWVNHSIGDPASWQPYPIDNILIMKPLAEISNTNMMLQTTHRRYFFNLKMANPKKVANGTVKVFEKIKFNYPDIHMGKMMLQQMNREQAALKAKKDADKKKRDAVNPKNINLNYSYSGSKSIMPVSVFDDGLFTWFLFPKGIDQPAIFIVKGGRHEATINYRPEGDYIVVEQLADRFTIRDGDNVATVVRGKKGEKPAPPNSTGLSRNDGEIEQW